MSRAVISSVVIPDPGSLLDVVPHGHSVLWLRGGDGLVGWGEAARFEVDGQDRFHKASRWWREWLSAHRGRDEVGVPGSGPVAFGSFSFDSGRSVLIVPRVVVGRRAGVTWKTVVGDPGDATPVPLAPLPHARWLDDDRAATRWDHAVSETVRRLHRTTLRKVVLAREVRGVLDGPLDVRAVVGQLAARFPACWSFAVDGLVGSTPELLLRTVSGEVTSLVLAGTTWGGAGVDELMRSAKNSAEHAYAVRSVMDVLRDHCAELEAPAGPEPLRLSNVTHLATRVTGRLSADIDAMSLAGHLHPTAAVCGTPTPQAFDAIRELEGIDRGRFSGPVGWTDANGDGEWCIALRCAEIAGRSLRAFAGAGIVDGSIPASEWDETEAKFQTIRGLFAGSALLPQGLSRSAWAERIGWLEPQSGRH